MITKIKCVPMLGKPGKWQAHITYENGGYVELFGRSLLECLDFCRKHAKRLDGATTQEIKRL